MQRGDDQRNFTRFKVNKQAYTKLLKNSSPYHFAVVIDVSMGGMALNYLGKNQLSSKIDKLDVFLGNDIYLRDVTVEVVSDILLSRKKINSRRCSVKFVAPNQHQLNHLENFIKNHTIPAPATN